MVLKLDGCDYLANTDVEGAVISRVCERLLEKVRRRVRPLKSEFVSHAENCARTAMSRCKRKRQPGLCRYDTLPRGRKYSTSGGDTMKALRLFGRRMKVIEGKKK